MKDNTIHTIEGAQLTSDSLEVIKEWQGGGLPGDTNIESRIEDLDQVIGFMLKSSMSVDMDESTLCTYAHSLWQLKDELKNFVLREEWND